MYEAPVNNGIWTTKLNWLAGRISSNHQQHFPVKMVIFVGFFCIFPTKLPLKLTHLSPRQLTNRNPVFSTLAKSPKVPPPTTRYRFPGGPTWHSLWFQEGTKLPKRGAERWATSQLRGVYLPFPPPFFYQKKSREKHPIFRRPVFF